MPSVSARELFKRIDLERVDESAGFRLFKRVQVLLDFVLETAVSVELIEYSDPRGELELRQEKLDAERELPFGLFPELKGERVYLEQYVFRIHFMLLSVLHAARLQLLYELGQLLYLQVSPGGVLRLVVVPGLEPELQLQYVRV